jgi:hypothetical protein
MPSDSVLLPIKIRYNAIYYDGAIMLKPGTNYGILKYIANPAATTEYDVVPTGSAVSFPEYKGTNPTDNQKIYFDWFLN